MAITLVCRNCEETQFTCCGGATSTELFRGLEINDNGTVIKVYQPFDVVYTASAAIVSDLKGTTYSIPVVDTVYSSITELKSFINGCLCPAAGSSGTTSTTCCCDGNDAPQRQVFLDASGPSVTVTIAPIPEANHPILLEVYRDGGKSISGVHFVADPVTGIIDFTAGTAPRALEGEHIEVIIKQCSSAVYENFLNVSGPSITLVENSLLGVLSAWETEQFLELNSTNEVTLAQPLPQVNLGANLYVLRDGGKALHDYHFTIDYGANKLVFSRAFEVENLVVRYRPDDGGTRIIRVYRDGGEGIEGYHHSIDYPNNMITFARALENENVQVYILPA